MKFRIQHHHELASTNTFTLQLAAEGAAEGEVVVADFQTGGRGKPGRKWESLPGKNLLFSVLLRPPISPAQAPILTQTACRAVAKVLERDYDLTCTFKQPNDVLCGGKKICGVLVEARSKAGALEAVVIGMGVNVNAAGKELVAGATSMKELKEREFDRDVMMNGILKQFAADLAPLYQRGKVKV